MEIGHILSHLCSVNAGAGSEAEITAAIVSLFPKHKTATDAMGNLAVELCPKKAGRPVVMLEAHADEIGFIVTEVCADGRLTLAGVGGVDRRVLYASEVVFTTSKGTFSGTVCSDASDINEKESICADIGFSKENCPVSAGDRGYISSPFLDLGNGIFCAKALDNRAGCAALIKAAEAVGAGHNCGVYALFAVQEEIGLRGSGAGTFNINPDAALCVDASFADAPGLPAHRTGLFGGGPMIGISPLLNKGVTDDLTALAERMKIPYQTEILPASTGTDADVVSKTGGGVKTGLLSVPVRNMHTANETVCADDILQTARLLAAYIKMIGGESGV